MKTLAICLKNDPAHHIEAIINKSIRLSSSARSLAPHSSNQHFPFLSIQRYSQPQSATWIPENQMISCLLPFGSLIL